MEDLRRDVDRHERELKDLWEQKAQASSIEQLRRELSEHRAANAEDNASTRRFLMLFLIGIAGSAVTTALAVVISAGGPH